MAMQRSGSSSDQEILVTLHDPVDTVRTAIRVALRTIHKVPLPRYLPSAQEMLLRAGDHLAVVSGPISDSYKLSSHHFLIQSDWTWRALAVPVSWVGAWSATVSDFTFDHFVDRASPNLMKYCLTGKHIAEAVLVVRKAGGNPLEYLKLTMSDVLVTMVSPRGSSQEEGLYETVALSFAKVKQEYVVQNAQGGSGGAVTAGYDIKGNKEA
jgi:type VI protein secretion system component Hcp